MTNDRPMTEKQEHFLGRLINERAVTDEQRGVVMSALERGMTSREASGHIDALLGLPKRPTEPGVLPPEGIHYVDGVIYKVKPSRSGWAYAKRLDLDPRGWQYVAREPFHLLSADTLITPEQAYEFATAYGVCANCGKDLTDPKSVERGVGPVCAKRLGFTARGLKQGGHRDENAEPRPRRTRKRVAA